MVVAIVTEIMRLTAFAPESPLRLAPAAQLHATLKDGGKVAQNRGFVGVSLTCQRLADTKN
jgi:hypothetical protein